MTRKRFVKLMMSYGYSRNVSEYIARTVPGRGSYEEKIQWYMLQNALSKATGLMVETLERWAKSLSEAMTRMAEAI